MLSAQFCVPPSHPCLADHFPGYPIAPGVLTLDFVAQGLLDQQSDMALVGFPQVKFLQPVLPAQDVSVTYVKKQDNIFQFSCVCGDTTLVTGQIRLKQKGAILDSGLDTAKGA